MKRYLQATCSYLGGKRRLSRQIMQAVAQEVEPGATFVDPFFGAGSVSITAKALGYRVLSNDVSPISEALGKVLIENPDVVLQDPEIARALTHTVGDVKVPGDRQLAVPSNCRQVLARIAARERETNGDLRWLVRAWLAKSAIAMAHWGIPNITAGRREWDELTTGQALQRNHAKQPAKLALRCAHDLNGGVFYNGKRNEMHRGDAIEFLQDLDADVVYFDPPYPGVSAYEKVYAGVANLVEPGTSPVASPWSERDGWKLLAKAFDAAERIPVWIVSMGKGANPEAIARYMEERDRRTSWRSINHLHLQALQARPDAEGDELLIVGRR